MRLNLFDITEVARAGVHELVVFGRLETGEMASIFVRDLEHYLYLAVDDNFDVDSLMPGLVQHINKGVQRERCGRTLCSCSRCQTCRQEHCICKCAECFYLRANCQCFCMKCSKAPCKCPTIPTVEINNETCVKLRRQDEEPILGIDRVMRKGLLGYEPGPLSLPLRN